MLAGAELFLAPTACNVTEADHRLMAVRGRENAAGAVLVNYAPSNATPAAHINNAQGGSVAVDHVGNVVAVGSATEEVVLAKFDIAALRAYRQTARGQALTSPRLHPEICALKKPTNTAPDSGPWGRMNSPF